MDWKRDEMAVATWHKEHPMGALTLAEHDELDDLLMIEIGSYYIFLCAKGIHEFDPYIDSRIEDVREWKI